MTPLLDNRTLQTFLQKKKLYNGPIDGIVGSGTVVAINSALSVMSVIEFAKFASWSPVRRRTAVEQYALSEMGFRTGAFDGLVGPQTMDALERYQNSLRDNEPPASSIQHLPTRWPRESQMHEFYGMVGQNQVSLKLPYVMSLAWDTSTKVKTIQCHQKVHDSLGTIFTKIHEHYKSDVSALGLDLFGGCLNVRQKKGGRSYSMHSWGAAVDLDPARNQLRWGRDRAQFAKSDYDDFWAIVEGEGWVSLGREKNYDWMHFQAARF